MKLVIDVLEDDQEERWKIVKACAKGFEGAMGCECLSDIDSPYCPATTFQEVRDLMPKGCNKREFSDWVETYCNVRNGKEICFKCKYAGIANEKYEYIF